MILCFGRSVDGRSPGSPHLNDVPLQHRLLGQNSFEAEVAQVQRFKVPVQDQFCHCATHSGGVLQAVAAEAGGKVHVIDQRVNPDDAVLVEAVVVIETRPRTAHLRRGTRGKSDL